jgi:drug/metabolite transporter (DMT)-like permease
MRYWVGAGYVLLAAFCFALKGVMIKLAYRYGVDALSLLTLRMLFALPFYASIRADYRLCKWLPDIGDWWLCLVLQVTMQRVTWIF